MEVKSEKPTYADLFCGYVRRGLVPFITMTPGPVEHFEVCDGVCYATIGGNVYELDPNVHTLKQTSVAVRDVDDEAWK